MYTDPIADMLTRVRNAQMVKKSEVILPYSKVKFNIAKLLEAEKWLGKVEVLEPQVATVAKNKNEKEKENKFKSLKIEIKYEDKSPKIQSLKRISKPGRRIYVNKEEIPVVRNNYGLAVISTSKGLMVGKQAKKEGLGGEVVCEVY